MLELPRKKGKGRGKGTRGSVVNDTRRTARGETWVKRKNREGGSGMKNYQKNRETKKNCSRQGRGEGREVRGWVKKNSQIEAWINKRYR